MIFRIISVAAAGSMVALTVFAVDVDKVWKSVELKDGSTVHIFADGKMGMEDRFGRPMYMEPGTIMVTMDGKKMIMIGNEVRRIEKMRKDKYPSG